MNPHHTQPSDPAWVEWTADMDRRVAQDYSQSRNRIVVRRYRLERCGNSKRTAE